jgi:hypothetical protein
VAAFSNDGDEFARWSLLKKLAPAYRSMMVNTADSPIMEIFRKYEQQSVAPPTATPVTTTGN